MLPSDVAWSLIISVAAAALVAFSALLLYAALQLIRRRPVPVWAVRGILIALGLFLGFLLLATNGTATPRLVTLIAAAILVAVVFLTRPRTGGAVLVAIALPWTMWWASFLTDNAIAGGHWAMAEVVAAVIPGVAAIVAGAFSFFAFGRSEAERHPSRPEKSDERPFGATGMAMLGPRVLGLPTGDLASLVLMFAAALVTASLVHGRPFVEGALVTLAGGLVAWAGGSVAYVLARRPKDRRAWEAYTWLGEWELDRYRAIVGGPMLPTKDDFRKWLKASPDRPDLGWIRAELFVMEREFDKARETAEAMPVDTPYDRVEREAALASTDWYSGGPGDTTALHAAADEVPPDAGDESLRVAVIVASAEVRKLLAAGDPDPTRPTREVRNRLGARADGILWTVLRRRLWSKLLMTALTIVVLVVALTSAFPLS